MSVLLVGISHRSAPVDLLERLALGLGGVDKILADTAATEHVDEVVVVATCNRLEVYAKVSRFHGGVEDLTGLLADRAGRPVTDLAPHLYVHYDEGAVSHLFHLAAGLDSLALGESQILGQVRDALRSGQSAATVGPVLNVLFQQALRVGKRAHAETDLDRAAPSLVAAGLDRLPTVVGARAVVVGAGSMAALATATLLRRGAADVVIVNRTSANAARLATEYDVSSAPLTELEERLRQADVAVCCTGAGGPHVTAEMGRRLAADRTTGRPLALLDIALPHDVAPDVAGYDGVAVVTLADLVRELSDADTVDGVDAARTIVASEVAAYRSARLEASVTPTVVALRSMATRVVDAEIERLLQRLPDLDPVSRDEVTHAVRRVADKLLHQPTVRVKELATQDGAVSYPAALAELFALPPSTVAAVTRPEQP